MAEQGWVPSDRFVDPVDDESDRFAEADAVTELQADRVDDVAERLAAVVDLAAGLRQWRFGHVIVDEAQDLTPMQWRMITRRAIGGSMTVVGDLAQRSEGGVRSWDELLPAEVGPTTHRELSVNYRSPSEINDVATRLLDTRALDIGASRSIRSTGHPVRVVDRGARGWAEAVVSTVTSFVADRPGRVAVVHPAGWDALEELDDLVVPGAPQLDVVSATGAKGLEFDHVVVVDPLAIVRPADLYVAVTRATQRLAIVHAGVLPDALARALSPGDR